MKTKSFLWNGALGVIFAGLVLIGCHKDYATTPTSATDVTAAEDDANANYAAYDSKNISDQAMQSQASNSAYKQSLHGTAFTYGTCASIHGKDSVIGGMLDTVVYIDFGKTDCFCRDSRNRRGTIIVYWALLHAGETWRQAYFDSTNTITMTFQDYYVRDNGIAGTRTWTNEGHDVSGYENWNFTADLTITYPNGQTATWAATRNNAITQVDGVWYYEVSGGAHGVGRNDVNYTVTITSPVYFTLFPWWAGGCPWPEAGIVTITRVSPAGGSATLTVNYGTLGTCNGNKIVTFDGKTETIAMW